MDMRFNTTKRRRKKFVETVHVWKLMEEKMWTIPKHDHDQR